jgi:hypothetical protein
VHPYVFRQICRNGAIMAWAQGSREIRRADEEATPFELERVAEEVRAEIRACATPEVLFASVSQMRTAQQQEADMALTLLPTLARLPGSAGEDLLRMIEQRFEEDRGRSVFGLMNAITSVARDTRDPETRWELEELGGGVLAGLRPKPRPHRGARQLVRV